MENIAAHGAITQSDLETFLAQDDLDDNAIQYREMYKAVRFMINPAFYDSTAGFLGTYDGTTFYKYTQTGVVESSDPDTDVTNFTILNALDLSGISGYVPADVVSATITVE